MIRDIKPPVYFKADFTLLIFLGVLILLIVGAALASFVYKKMKKPRKKPAPLPKSAREVALEELEKLRVKNLPALGRVKEYYYGLSDIVRHYTEGALGLRAPEMTTEEFLRSLRGHGGLSGAHKNLLKEFLTLSDVVKFAKYGPGPEETEASFVAAKNFIDGTK